MKIKIINAEILTLDDKNTVFDRGEIHIDGEKIVFAGDNAPLFDADRVIDAKGNAVMPGFVNTHTHLPMNLFRSYADDMELMPWLETKIWPAEDKMDEQAVYFGTLAALYEMARGGITAFSDAYYLYDWQLPAIKQSKMRGLISRSVVDFDKAQGEIKFAEMIKHFECDKKGRVDVGFAAHAIYTCSPDMMARMAKEAKERGAKIQVHLSETQNENENCKKQYGKSPVEVLADTGLLDNHTIAAHCVWLSDSDKEILKDKNVFVSHCPSSNLKLASGIAPVFDLKNKGINVSLGTDSASSNNALSVWREMTIMSLLQKGASLDPKAMNAFDSLKAATKNGAIALGLDSGSIEKGKNADIIMIDTSGVRYSPAHKNTAANIVYSGSDSDVLMTMVGGDIIYENGEVSFCDINEVKAKMNEFIKCL